MQYGMLSHRSFELLYVDPHRHSTRWRYDFSRISTCTRRLSCYPGVAVAETETPNRNVHRQVHDELLSITGSFRSMLLMFDDTTSNRPVRGSHDGVSRANGCVACGIARLAANGPFGEVPHRHRQRNVVHQFDGLTAQLLPLQLEVSLPESAEIDTGLLDSAERSSRRRDRGDHGCRCARMHKSGSWR